MLDLAGCDQHMRTGRGCDLGRLDLGAHAAARQLGFRGARHRFDVGRHGIDDRYQFGVWIIARRRIVESVDIRQQDQEIRARHGGDAGGEAIVVAVTDLARCHRVVLVDDRHGAQFEELRDSRARIEIAPPLLGVAEREQNLSGPDAMTRQRLGPGARQRDLADRGGRLALLELERRGRQLEHAAAERDRA